MVSNSIIDQVVECKIRAIVLSDHAMVELDIALNTKAGKKGRWHLNIALIQDECFGTLLADDLTSFFKLNIESTDRLASVWEASKAYI